MIRHYISYYGAARSTCIFHTTARPSPQAAHRRLSGLGLHCRSWLPPPPFAFPQVGPWVPCQRRLGRRPGVHLGGSEKPLTSDVSLPGPPRGKAPGEEPGGNSGGGGGVCGGHHFPYCLAPSSHSVCHGTTGSSCTGLSELTESKTARRGWKNKGGKGPHGARPHLGTRSGVSSSNTLPGRKPQLLAPGCGCCF